jgi:hypothetical protein
MSHLINALLIGTVALTAGCTYNEPARLPAPGRYEESSSRTSPSGTTTDRQTSTEVTVDQYGNKTAVTKNTTTTDPNGLFNSRTDTNTRVTRERN